jgi:hypothetical protein
MKRKEQIFITKIYKSKKCDFCGVKGKNGVPL